MIVFDIQGEKWQPPEKSNLARDFDQNRDITLHIANFDKTSGYVKRMSTLEMLVASLRQSGVVIADFISEATRERIVEGSRRPWRNTI